MSGIGPPPPSSFAPRHPTKLDTYLLVGWTCCWPPMRLYTLTLPSKLALAEIGISNLKTKTKKSV